MRSKVPYLMTTKLKNLRFTKNLKFFDQQSNIFLIDLHDGLSSSRRSLQPSRESIHLSKHDNSATFSETTESEREGDGDGGRDVKEWGGGGGRPYPLSTRAAAPVKHRTGNNSFDVRNFWLPRSASKGPFEFGPQYWNKKGTIIPFLSMR